MAFGLFENVTRFGILGLFLSNVSGFTDGPNKTLQFAGAPSKNGGCLRGGGGYSRGEAPGSGGWMAGMVATTAVVSAAPG